MSVGPMLMPRHFSLIGRDPVASFEHAGNLPRLPRRARSETTHPRYLASVPTSVDRVFRRCDRRQTFTSSRI